jgi:hypothetical protein
MMDTVTLENINADVPFDEVDAMRQKQREQEKIDMYALYDVLLEGRFYEDHDESTRLVGALRRHLFRMYKDQRPGK